MSSSNSPVLVCLIASLALAFAVGWLLIRFEWLHAAISHDHTASGPQKFHVRPTPRIGGVPVAAGLLSGFFVAWEFGDVAASFIVAFTLALLPAYASGLLEDITKKLGPDMRLWASFMSALVAAAVFDVVVARSGLEFVDRLLSWYPLALGVTVVGVGGVAHALNLIDGYNGLAGVVSMMMHAAIALVSWKVGDLELVIACVAMIGSTFGFLVWNFPSGRIFAGDGGAYLWGVSVAILSVLLIGRHAEVSPWFPLAVVIYPVFETLFTVWRRKLGKAGPAGAPDARHLHQLVYRRVLTPPAARALGNPEALIRRNAWTSPFLWALAALSILPAVVFWRDSAALMGVVAGFCLFYVWLYRGIAGFSTPRALRRLGRRAGLRALRGRG
jgi:UDP-GlcNAc:undecaprenyl-phosphate GlcNAc-1-phosphate transferase